MEWVSKKRCRTIVQNRKLFDWRVGKTLPATQNFKTLRKIISKSKNQKTIECVFAVIQKSNEDKSCHLALDMLFVVFRHI